LQRLFVTVELKERTRATVLHAFRSGGETAEVQDFPLGDCILTAPFYPE
jgi:hypothetical protein